MSPRPVAILPAGEWGTALAVMLARHQRPCRLWLRRSDEAAEVRAKRVHARVLPGVDLPPSVEVVDSPAAAVADADLVVLAPASSGMSAVCQAARAHLPRDAILLSGTKGIEPEAGLRMSQVIAAALPEHAGRIGALSGPNFAREIARGLPAATVVAFPDLALAERVQQYLMTPSFRVYTNADLAGVELGGALKNVIAIAVGICVGMGFGQNAAAALITRGLVEIGRLGARLGANPLTFAGLSGLGDLVLTCTSEQSRNLRLGLRIGRGTPAAEAIAAAPGLVEGVRTTMAAVRLARRLAVPMPISDALHAVLFEGLDPGAGVLALMERTRTREVEEVPFRL